jgi:hypothetical protein
MNYLKPILALTLALGSTLAHASVLGTPDEDPVIKDLRARFEQGTAPTQEELVGKTFLCKQRDADRNDFSMDESEHSFIAFDGYVTLTAPKSLSNGQIFVNNSREWITTMSVGNAIAFFAYRKDSKGYLIREYGFTNPTNPMEISPLSAAPAGAKVGSYSICIPKK